MNISNISQNISDVLTKELDYSEDKKEIIAYGIESLILVIVGSLSIVGVSLLFNALFPAVIAALFGGFLRQLSGGAHFNTPLKCLSYGAIVYSLLGVVAKEMINHGIYSSAVLLIILFLSLVIVTILAPVDSESKPIHASSFRRKLKFSSVVFILVTFIVILISKNNLLNISAVLGVGYQSLTLLPIFNKK